MSTYRERREARAERLRGWADSRDTRGNASLDRAHQMADAIPFGQPILGDHYSAGRDRNYRNRIQTTTDRGYADTRKATEMRARADNIDAAANRAIYSDDPDAVEALTEKLAKLEAKRDRIKTYNASARKGTPDTTVLTERERTDLATVTLHQSEYIARRRGQFPPYVLSNLSGTIKTTRDRLARMNEER